MKKLWRNILKLRLVSKYFDLEWSLLRKLFISSLIWMLACEIIMIIQYWPLQGITNLLVASVNSHQPIMFDQVQNLLLFLALSLGFGIWCHNKMDNKRNNFLQGQYATMQASAIDKLLTLPTSWHVEHSTGEKDSKVKDNVDRLEYIAQSMAYGAFPVTMRNLVTALALLWVDWLLFLFGMGAALSYLLLTRINLPFMKSVSKSWHDQREEISDHSKSLMANWYSLRSFGAEDRYIENHYQVYRKYWDDDVQRHRPYRLRLCSHESLVAAITVLFYWLLSSLTRSNVVITVGTMVMALFWMTRMLNNLYQLNDFLRYYHRGVKSLNEMIVFFETPSDMPQPEKPLWPKKFNGAISFKNVSFRYPGKEKFALKNVNLDIQPGEVIALVGESGGGKSTIASLIAGERPATEGVVEVNGIDIRNIDLRRYRREGLAVVPQRSSLLPATIAENVCLGKPDATDEQIIESLRQAYALDFVEQLPAGIHSKVGEHGVYLSGGQQQRIAIARAFIRDTSRILVLDEATSSLDGSSQKEVQTSLERLISQHDNKTVVVIAHRLSTVQIAQRIIVLQNGEIIDQGTHDQLLQSCCYYKHLCQLEFGSSVDSYIAPTKLAHTVNG